MKTKSIKKTIALVLVFLISITTLSLSASAAATFPSLSSTAYCEFTATKTISVFRDSAFGTRGTSSPAQSYNAEIWSGDVCQIISITSTYIQLKYPTSSGLKTGYIKRGDLIGVSAPEEVITSKGKVTTYTKGGGASYGYTESGDTVYKLGSSGGYTAIIYSAKSGNRSCKFGFVLSSEYDSKIKGSNVSTSKPVWPTVGGTITQGDTSSHSTSTFTFNGKKVLGHAIDIAVPVGTNIYATKSGTVYRVADLGNTSFGKYIYLQHDDGTWSAYCHLSKFNVNEKDYVKQGQTIALSGNSGGSTGPHLHFEITDGQFPTK